MKSQLKSGAFLAYATLILGNLITIIITPISLGLLGEGEYGLNSIANAFIGNLSILNLGLSNAFLRYITKYRVEGDKEKENSLSGLFLCMYLVLASIAIIIGSILIVNSDKVFAASLTSVEIQRIKVLMGIMVFNFAISLPTSIFSSVILSHERFIFLKVMDITRIIITPMITLPVLFFGFKSIGLAVAGSILNIVFITISIYYCFKYLDMKINIRIRKIENNLIKEIMAYSSIVFVNIIVDRIYWSTDQIILGVMTGTKVVTVYTIGASFSNYYMSFSTALSGIFVPKVMKMIAGGATDKELSDFFIRIGRIQYIILSYILVGFLIVGRDFIYLWVGEGFEDSYIIAILVMIPLTIPLIQNTGISILQAKNKHKFRGKVYIIIAFINLFATVILVNIYGGIGAALATGISFTIGNVIIMNIYYNKKINLDIKSFFKNIMKLSLASIVSLTVMIFINKNIIIDISILNLVIKGIIHTVIFSGIMYVFSINKYEKYLINEYRGKIKKLIKKS